MFGFSFCVPRTDFREQYENEWHTDTHQPVPVRRHDFSFPISRPFAFSKTALNLYIDHKLVAIRKFTWKMYTNCALQVCSRVVLKHWKNVAIFFFFFVPLEDVSEITATNDMLNYYNRNYFDFLFFEMSSHFSFEMVSIRWECGDCFHFVRPFTVTHTERKREKNCTFIALSPSDIHFIQFR